MSNDKNANRMSSSQKNVLRNKGLAQSAKRREQSVGKSHREGADRMHLAVLHRRIEPNVLLASLLALSAP
jgi:hypothetical protein